MRAFYFGTYRRAGHYLWDERMQWVSHSGYGESFRYDAPLPWRVLDGALNPNREEGRAALHHKEGWTAIAFANYTDDQRGNSNSAFFLEAELDFDQALAKARDLFPQVVDRFDFEIVQVGV